MNQKQLNAIKERVTKATPGPWEYDEEDRGIWNKGALNYLGTVTLSHIDAEFITHARDDVPALVEEVERLREVVKEFIDYWATTNDARPLLEIVTDASRALGGEAHG